MIERAVKLRDAIELYQTHFRSLSDCDRLPCSDCLETNDWAELQRLLEVLLPLKSASLRLQEDNDAKHALCEQLAVFDSLLSEFERLKERYRYEPNTHIKACVNLGWKKLDKYYGLSDKTFAYRMAIFLHPHLKMAWFERHWAYRPAWIEAAKEAIDNAYSFAKNRWPEDAQKAISLKPMEPIVKSESTFESIIPYPKRSTQWTICSSSSVRSVHRDSTRPRRLNGGARITRGSHCCDISRSNSLQYRLVLRRTKGPSRSPAIQSATTDRGRCMILQKRNSFFAAGPMKVQREA